MTTNPDVSPKTNGGASRYPVKMLPLPIRLINAVGDLLNRILRRTAPNFTEEKAIASAVKQTGLSDFGEDNIRTPLRMVCKTISQSPRMTPIGQYWRQKEIVMWLKTRLYVEAALKKNPSILQQGVRRPWFVLGLPRTGTTLLHRLLAQDPAHRAPLLWECIAYHPQIEHQKKGKDPRIDEAINGVRLLDYIVPEFRHIHEIGAELPEECLHFLANGLVTGPLTDLSEEMRDWVLAQDLTKTYKIHKQQLQILQHGAPAKTWILKCPVHLLFLRWLLKEYPDACIIQTHRDPVEVLPSFASLFVLRARLSYDHNQIDPTQLGQRAFTDLITMLETGSKAREEAVSKPGFQGRFLDVTYSDLIKDPLGVVGQIYQTFDTPLSDEAASRMKAYLDANKQHKFGKHKYSLEEFGLDPQTVRETFANYTNRYLQSKPVGTCA